MNPSQASMSGTRREAVAFFFLLFFRGAGLLGLLLKFGVHLRLTKKIWTRVLFSLSPQAEVVLDHGATCPGLSGLNSLYLIALLFGL